MEKEFVNYNQSLALKELGFDEDCFAFHSTIYGLVIGGASGNSVLYESAGECLAPLKQQGFRWFREKYDLWQCIQKYPTSENPNRCYYELKGDNINADKDESPNSYMSGWFDSYEEAELACIDKLIEIVQQRK